MKYISKNGVFVTLVDLSLSEKARSIQLPELLPSLEIAKKSKVEHSFRG